VRPILKWSLVVLLGALALILIVPLIMRLSVAANTYNSTESVPETEVAIVLGASVVRDKPSPVLAARANEAVELYQKGKVQKILVTGDSGDSTHDEVTPVRDYLLESGIPTEDIFLDPSGFDTYSSMYRARAVFGTESATIVTQNFHLPRALFLARTLGIDAVGVVAPGGEYLWQSYLREIPASWKAIFDIILKRQPKFMGEPVTLSSFIPKA